MVKRKIINQFLNAFGKRGDNQIIGIVIHCISAIDVAPKKPYDLQLILGVLNHHNVSADYLIDRKGQIYSLIPSDCYAYHAGISIMPTGETTGMNNNQSTVNKITVGIELVGHVQKRYTQKQYDSCAWLCLKLICENPLIDLNHIVGHEHVAPGRKKDPGPLFDWNLLFEKIFSFKKKP